MKLTTVQIPGAEAIGALNEYRRQYSTTRQYPFLIGERQAYERIRDNAESGDQDPRDIIEASLQLDTKGWIAGRLAEAEENEFSLEETFGHWPGEEGEKGSICLHKDIVSGKLWPEVYLGLVNIEEPWHLPAVLQYGGWNECPEAEIQCAFHRQWQQEFGANITGISDDIIECAVARPPARQNAAERLAWRQYWYCPDIVDQGCGTVGALAATVLNSPYWFFWWD